MRRADEHEKELVDVAMEQRILEFRIRERKKVGKIVGRETKMNSVSSVLK